MMLCKVPQLRQNCRHITANCMYLCTHADLPQYLVELVNVPPGPVPLSIILSVDPGANLDLFSSLFPSAPSISSFSPLRFRVTRRCSACN